MKEKDAQILKLLEEALESGSWVRLFKIAQCLEKRATFEKEVSELLAHHP